MDEVTRILIFAVLFTLTAAVLLLLSFTISRRRAMQHKKELLEQAYKTREEALLQMSRDLHDDIGSSLSGINMLNQLAQEQLKQPGHGNAAELLQKINSYTGEVIEKVSDMAWLLKPAAESISLLVNKIKLFSKAATSSKNISLHFTYTPPIPARLSDIRERKVLYLISKEAINNAVKYSGCRNLYCRIILQEKKLLVEVEDDGQGFNINEITPGNGLMNMKARADEIGAKLIIDTAPGKGTVVKLEL
ncbi:MAG: hypothetical protein HYX40_06030 [Sphingobacteriales bacterium]|nr:hypothetical protein [Sphingobacteriales bacterium]